MNHIKLLFYIRDTLWVSPTCRNLMNAYTFVYNILCSQENVGGVHELGIYLTLVEEIYDRYIDGPVLAEGNFDTDISRLNIIFYYLRKQRFGYSMDDATRRYRRLLIQRQACFRKYTALISVMETNNNKRLTDVMDIRLRIAAMVGGANTNTAPRSILEGEKLFYSLMSGNRDYTN